MKTFKSKVRRTGYRNGGDEVELSADYLVPALERYLAFGFVTRSEHSNISGVLGIPQEVRVEGGEVFVVWRLLEGLFSEHSPVDFNDPVLCVGGYFKTEFASGAIATHGVGGSLLVVRDLYLERRTSSEDGSAKRSLVGGLRLEVKS